MAGLTTETLPSTLTASNFTVTLDGTKTKVMGASRSASAGLSLCFILDTTGSMSGELAGVLSSVQAFVDSFTGRTVWVSGVEYGDSVRTHFAPSTDVTAFKAWVSGLGAYGGDDTPEDPLDAFMYAKTDFAWPAGAARNFIVITDATAHQAGDGGDSATTQTISSVLSAFRGWGVIHAVDPDWSESWVTPTTTGVKTLGVKSKANDGVSTENLSGKYGDVRELADGGPPASRTNTGTGGKWTVLTSPLDLTTLGIAEAIGEAYTVTYGKPTDMTSAHVIVTAKWGSSGTATWDLGTVTF